MAEGGPRSYRVGWPIREEENSSHVRKVKVLCGSLVSSRLCDGERSI